MARPRIEIDQKKFEEMCIRQHTLSYIAYKFGCSEDTIERWVARTYPKKKLSDGTTEKASFADVSREKRELGYSDLRGKMFETAMNGNVTMQIYLSKNWLGMSDKPEQSADTEDSETYFDEAGI